MCSAPRHVESGIDSGSDYLALTFKMVVEHIQDIALARGRRYHHVAEVLEIILTLVKRTTLPLVGTAWINDLLKRAAHGDVADEEFLVLLKLSAWRKEEGATISAVVEDAPIQHFGTDPQPLERTVASEVLTPDDVLFRKVMKTIQTHGIQDEAAYGGLLAIRDILRLEPSLLDDDTLQTFHEAMDDANPLRIRQAAYDAILVTRDQWPKSERLRQRLENLGFFGRLRNVVAEMARSDYYRSFLLVMEVLSEDVYWHPYLREAMGVWLPLRHEAPERTLSIIVNIGELSPPGLNGRYFTSFDEVLQKLVVDGWAAVPGRPVLDLTADRLKPLAEVTEQLNDLLFDDYYRRGALTAVQEVISGMEQRRDDDYEGPGEDVRGIVHGLLGKLRLPPRRPSTYSI